VDRSPQSFPIPRENFANHYFLGHLNPDTDSIAAAVALAHFYSGIPLRAGELNEETDFILKKFGHASPQDVEGVKHGERKVCLVDFNQMTQLHGKINHDDISCIFDHHGLQTNIVTPFLPIHLEIRPYGSCSTLASLKYFEANRPLDPSLAGLLLAGILSDTLNLSSPTTTTFDREAVHRLQKLARITDRDIFAQQMFYEKSRVDKLTVSQIIARDFKLFQVNEKKLGFGVIETLTPELHIARRGEFQEELVKLKLQYDLSYIFLGVVDVMKLNTKLILVGEQEETLALLAYPNSQHVAPSLLDIGSRVSRKKEFIPPLQQLL